MALAQADARRAHCRPRRGELGAVAAASPAAAGAGRDVLLRGGSAVDAALAAHAVICVTMPQAAGLGGDLLALVRTTDGEVTAVGGTGRSPARTPPGGFATTGGASVTVPGLVAATVAAHARWGRLPLTDVLAAATALARDGMTVDAELAAVVDRHRGRLHAGGADGWALLSTAPGSLWRQPELAALLEAVAEQGAAAFYRGPVAGAVAAAVARCGGTLSEDDLAEHRGLMGPATVTGWAGGTAHCQPAPTQGVLLAMVLNALEGSGRTAVTDHLLVELTGAAFEHRSDAALGAELLDRPLVADEHRASGRTGPRAYLHTAGVAAADAQGMVVSSLISVFDDFGSAVYVPEAGVVLNNRAGGFTTGANSPLPGRRPVHTLAPALLHDRTGAPLALATPGADGQVQTLLQVLAAQRYGARGLDEALAAPRWRSEAGRLLVETGHPGEPALRAAGHDLDERPAGDGVFGAVVAAGLDLGRPFAAADWRRDTAAEVA